MKRCDGCKETKCLGKYCEKYKKNIKKFTYPTKKNNNKK